MEMKVMQGSWRQRRSSRSAIHSRRCMLLQKAIVDYEITKEKGDTIEAIGRWTKTSEWHNASSTGNI
eukprot:15945292-Heterocapsa_arctica.AAC.1